jgi:hypothetical protein
MHPRYVPLVGAPGGFIEQVDGLVELAQGAVQAATAVGRPGHQLDLQTVVRGRSLTSW